MGEAFEPVDRLYSWLEGAARGEMENTDVAGDVKDWLEGLEETLAPILG